MGIQMDVLINQMIQFAVIVALGFIIFKVGLVNDAIADGISAFSIKYCFPLMLFTTIVGGATRAELFSMGPFIVAVIICEGVMLAGGIISGKLFRFKQPTFNVHIGCTAYGNTGFVGLPVALALFPETGALPVAIYMLIDFIVMYSVTPVLCLYNGGGKAKLSFRRAVNTITIAAVIGFIFVIIGLKPVNNPVWDAVEGIGVSSKYITLSYLGADIARKGFSTIFKNKKVFITVGLKLMVLPLAAFLLINALGLFNYEQSMIVLIMMLSPTMTAIAFLAREGGSDEDFAVSSIVLSHIACLLTVPLGVWIANIL